MDESAIFGEPETHVNPAHVPAEVVFAALSPTTSPDDGAPAPTQSSQPGGVTSTPLMFPVPVALMFPRTVSAPWIFMSGMSMRTSVLSRLSARACRLPLPATADDVTQNMVGLTRVY
jgi:hypothetical protein